MYISMNDFQMDEIVNYKNLFKHSEAFISDPLLLYIQSISHFKTTYIVFQVKIIFRVNCLIGLN